MSGQPETAPDTFAYYGLGDRMRQIVGGTPTTYVNDYAAGLTQVLSDGTNTYLYGAGRIAQYNTGMQYFGADGLGSVRQMYDATGTALANKRYDPYGNVLSATGAGSMYGFTGEATDATGLVYLRARYMDPMQGRFIARDTWAGDYQRPLSLNGWNYTQANPVNSTDPSGHDPWWCDARADEILCLLSYNIDRGGKLDRKTLKAAYQINPNEALDLLSQQFNINLPPGHQFRYSLQNTLLPEGAGGGNPWFMIYNWTELPRFVITEWSDETRGLIATGVSQCNIEQGDVAPITRHIDYSVYVNSQDIVRTFLAPV